MTSHQNWQILKPLAERSFKGFQKKFACLLLNISNQCGEAFSKYQFVWNEAFLRVAVNGSANYLSEKRLIQTADIVCGDFDSIDKSLIQYLKYGNKASSESNTGPSTSFTNMPEVVETPSQKETDFTKAVRVSMGLRSDLTSIFALYYSDGSRLDHLFGLVNTLHLFKKKIILINVQSDTISWLLAPGSHTIEKHRGPHLCSVVPFDGPAAVTTKGLLYDIQPNPPLSFAGRLSTSNICQQNSDNISLETDKDVLFSIDLPTREK